MNKQEFLTHLRGGLSRLPEKDREERITFYSEMIDDIVEEGASEDEAVSSLGSVDEVISQIIAEVPLSKIVKENVKPKREMKTWEIGLLLLGSPLWVPLLISVLAVIFSLYIVMWSVIVSVWAVFVSLCACVIGVLTAAVLCFAFNSTAVGIAVVGVGITLAGLSIFAFFACRIATKGILILTKKTTVALKKSFLKKEVA